MLILSFNISDDRYSISAKNIIEILPLTQLKKISSAPEYIMGLLNYRGITVPVIDLCQLTEHRSHKKVLSSRIILVSYVDANNEKHTLGVTAEKVTEIINIKRNDFFSSGLTLEEAPYLGAITHTDDNVIQHIDIDNLLPENVQKMLFQNIDHKTQLSN